MIFVTVGSQMPFDRMVRALDAWAHSTGHAGQMLAQIGDTDWQPKHLRWVRALAPDEFRKTCQEAELIVAHAGMGSILAALEMGKPILVTPRRGHLKETRNDHQVATVNWLRGRPGIEVADDEHQLCIALGRLIGTTSSNRPGISPYADTSFSDQLRRFIEG